jgi:hypothetical protein
MKTQPEQDLTDHYIAAFRRSNQNNPNDSFLGTILQGGTFNIPNLQACAMRSPDLRTQLGIFFGILTPEGQLPGQTKLPQIRKNIPAYLMTGTKNKVCTEAVTYKGTRQGFWRVQHRTGRTFAYTPGPEVLVTSEGIDLFTGKPSVLHSKVTKQVSEVSAD